MFNKRGISQNASDAVETPKGYDDYEIRLGDILRGERATLGLSLDDVQDAIKIRKRYLEAIENTELDVFEAQSFIPGYIRSYAKYLKLDPEDLFTRFCNESGFELSKDIGSERKATIKAAPRPIAKDPLFASGTPFAPANESVFDRIQPGAIGSILVLLAVLSGIGYGAWYALKEVQRVQLVPVAQPAEIAQLDPLESFTTEDFEVPADQQPVTTEFERLYRPDILETPIVVSRDAPIARLDPNEIGSLVSPDLTANQQIAESIAPPQQPQISEADPERIAVIVSRPAWVRIVAADGTQIFEKNMDVGEEFVLPNTEAAPILRAGMSGYVFLRVGQDVFGPVGSGANVVRDLQIGRADVVEQFAKADPELNGELSNAIQLAEAR